MDLRSRYRGALLGLATGDALGTTLEFRQPGSFDPIDDIVGGGPFDLPAGAWTDDTSMALCLAESLAERGGFDPVDQLDRYVRWWRDGYLSATGRCFDIGATVATALDRFERTREPFCGSTDPASAGNGSLMRLAPVALACRSDPFIAVARAADSSRTTHGAREAVDACRYFAGLLVGALGGASKTDLLDAPFAPARGVFDAEPLAPRIAEIAAGSFRRRNPPQIRGTGYVVHCLEAALWAFDRSGSFREAVLLAANLGDDADTTAAVAGQLAGAFYGEAGIPREWRARLAMGEAIAALAERLLRIGVEA